jgi:hypothetical protein
MFLEVEKIDYSCGYHVTVFDISSAIAEKSGLDYPPIFWREAPLEHLYFFKL